MESVRLLKRKAKGKRHFINCENMVEVLPSTSTYKGHTTNFQDDWPTTTNPWDESEDNLQPFKTYVENEKDIHFLSPFSRGKHPKIPEIQQFKSCYTLERFPHYLLQEEILSEFSKCGAKQIGNKVSSQHIKPLTERPVNVLENTSVLDMVDSITQNFTKALTNQSKVHSDACAGLYSLIQDVVDANCELGTAIFDGVQKQTMSMNTFFHFNTPQIMNLYNTKKGDKSFYQEEDTTNEMHHTENIIITNNQCFHSKIRDQNNAKDELILLQQSYPCENDLSIDHLVKSSPISNYNHIPLQNNVVIGELPLESNILNIDDKLISKINFSCQYENGINCKSIENFESQKTIASQTENALFTKEQSCGDHLHTMLYNEPKTNHVFQTMSFGLQNNDKFFQKKELNDDKNSKFQELNSLNESIKIDCSTKSIEDFQIQETIDFASQNNGGLDEKDESNNNTKYNLEDLSLFERSFNIDFDTKMNNFFEKVNEGSKSVEKIGNNLQEHDIMKVDLLASIYSTKCHFNDSNLNKSNNIIKSMDNCFNEYDLDEFEKDVESTSSIKDDEYNLQTKISNDSFIIETKKTQQHLLIDEESFCSQSINDVPMWNPHNGKILSDKLNQLSTCDENESKCKFEDVSIGLSSTNELSKLTKIEVDTFNNEEENPIETLTNDNNDISKMRPSTFHKDQTSTRKIIVINNKTYKCPNNKSVDIDTKDPTNSCEGFMSMSKTKKENSKDILEKVKLVNSSSNGLQITKSKLSSSSTTFTQINPKSQKRKNSPIWGRLFLALLKNYKRRLNAATIKIKSQYLGFRCRRLMWLRKGWKYNLLSCTKSKGDKKSPKPFFPLSAPCIGDENGIIPTLCCQPSANTLMESNTRTEHPKDMNAIEMRSRSNYISLSESMEKNLNNNKATYEGCLEGQIHKCYEKNSSQGQIHLCESKQSLNGPSVHVCYKKQSSQHQVHVCFNKQPSKDDIKSIKEHLKVEGEKKINNVRMENVWNFLEEKEFMALLACNLKKSQNYLIQKSSVRKGQKMAKKYHSTIKMCRFNAPNPSKYLKVGAFKNCVACGPSTNYCKDCVLCYHPPIHNCSNSCLKVKKEASPSKLVMVAMKEMTIKLCKLKHSAISLDFELKIIEQMHDEMAPTPAYDMLNSKPS